MKASILGYMKPFKGALMQVVMQVVIQLVLCGKKSD